MLIRSYISKSIHGAIYEYNKFKDFIKVIEEQFMTLEKVLASTLIKGLSSIEFDNSKGLHAHK